MGSHQKSQCHIMDYVISNSPNSVMKTIFEDPLQLSIVGPFMLLVTFLTLFAALEQIQRIRERTRQSPSPEAFSARQSSVTPMRPQVIPAHARSVTPQRPEVSRSRERSVTSNAMRPGGDKGPVNHSETQQQNFKHQYQYRLVGEASAQGPLQPNNGAEIKTSVITVHHRFSQLQPRASGVLLDCTAYNNPDANVTVRSVPSENAGWDLNVEINGAKLDMVAEDHKRFYLFYKKESQQ